MSAWGRARNVSRTIEPSMDDIESYRIVPSEPKSELQKFAFWFHQDWKLIFPDFHTGAEMYLSSLSPERKEVLRQALAQFIERNRDADASELIDEWVKLGAQAWQSDLDFLRTLDDFLRMMRP